ncbi:MAG: extracellular solute-binding protein [Propionibacteriaceae bacterium]|nr:extracellular solute-binding protein [Propionibacteriaceae bacterium]
MGVSRRTILLAGLGSAAAVPLVGCAPGTPTTTGGTTGAPTGQDAGGPLVVYSPWGDDMRAPFILEGAQEQGIEIEFVMGGGGELTSRLLAERNNSQADVVLGIGVPQMFQIADAGILSPYSPSWEDKIPEAFSVGDAPFTLLSQTPIVLAYNADRLAPADVPTSWDALAESRYKDKYIFPGVTSQTGQAAVAGILWRHADQQTGEVSEQGWEALTAIIKNARQVPAGQAYDWAKVASGEIPLIPSWLGFALTGGEDNGFNVEIADTEGGTPFISTGVGLVANSKRQETAKKFIDWFGGADFQASFVEATNNDAPVNPEALDQLPEVKEQLAGITPQPLDWKLVSEQMPGWLQRIQLEILG